MSTVRHETRERVLQASQALYIRVGFNGVTMDDVARAAGIGRATLYRHFDNRDEVLLGVIENEARAIAARVENKIRRFRTPGDYIIEGMLEAREEVIANPLLSEILQGGDSRSINRVLFHTDRLTNIGLEIMLPVIQRAQERGELKTEMSFAMLLEWIMRMLLSLLTIPSPQLNNKRAIRQMLRATMLPVLKAG